MIPSEGGTDFPYPMGDPGTIEAAANGLDAAATELTTAAGQMTSAASAVSMYWAGEAYQNFETSVTSVQAGLKSLASSHTDAGTALSTYAKVLRQAQADCNTASTTYNKAQDNYTSTMNSLDTNPPTGKGAAAKIATASNNANDTLNTAYNTANTACANAVTTATAAAKTCATTLEGIADDVKATALHKFLDLMGGPNTVFGALGVTMQVKSSVTAWNVIEAMNTGDYDALAKYNPKGWKVVEEARAKYGEDSSEALKAQFAFEEETSTEVVGGMADAATGVNAVPKGLGPGALDVLGKIGVVAGVASDVLTLADGQSSGGDKTAAAVNLLGIGMAASGTEAGTATLAILGLDSAGLAVPVVGEVLIAGTALYFGTEWVVDHWSDIKQWGSDVGGALEDGWHGVEDGYNWVNGKLNSVVDEFGHLLSDPF